MGEQAQPLEAPPPPDVERADIEVPTQIIDKDSQDISAVIPSNRTFYPLSDGFSTRNRRKSL